MDKESTFGGFTALGDALSNPDSSINIPNDDFVEEPIIDPPKDEDDDDIKDPSSIKDEDGNEKNLNQQGDPKLEQNEDDNTLSNDSNEDDVDLGEMESDIASYVQEKIFDKYGWDIEEGDTRFDSVDKLVEFLGNVIDENSKPNFANQELADLNEFVYNGGNIENYLKQRYDGNVDLEKLDITTSTNQNLVLREFFKEQGHDSSKIEKRLQRYEDTGIKEEEAKEAYEILKRVRKDKSDQLLESQKKSKEAALKQQQKFYTNVVSTIDELENIKGIPLSPGEKKQLTEYIFKPNPDGRTSYQKDYESSVNNLIESAYFTMKGDKLLTKINKKAASSAAKSLKERLETKTKRGKNTRGYEDDDQLSKGDFSLLSGLGSSLHKPQF